ncbi:hypothetical protein [Spirosoma fluminis]
MKNALLSIGFLVLINTACQPTNPIAPVVDRRDQQVGLYACEVTIRNFQTEEVFSTYLDTLEVGKQGESQLFIKSYKNTQFPALKSLDGRDISYTGLFTNLNFNQGQLQLTTGPDSAFYSYKGRKLN